MGHLSENIKDIDNRLATIEGHIRGVRQMVEQGKNCDEILLQLTAIKGSIGKLSKMVLIAHASTCVKNAVAENNVEEYERFVEVLNKYV